MTHHGNIGSQIAVGREVYTKFLIFQTLYFLTVFGNEINLDDILAQLDEKIVNLLETLPHSPMFPSCRKSADGPRRERSRAWYF